MRSAVLAVVLVLVGGLVVAGPGWAQELLVNGGFETGDLTGWDEGLGAGEGNVVTVSAPAAEPCARINPSTPRSGSYLFSTAVADGATALTPAISISQTIDVSGLPNGSLVSFSGFFAGAAGCNEFSSDDPVTVELALYGNAGTTLLHSRSAGPLDPTPGAWRELAIGETAVPFGADTLVVTIQADLDPGFASIDIGMDDLSVMAKTTPPVLTATWNSVFAIRAIGGTIQPALLVGLQPSGAGATAAMPDAETIELTYLAIPPDPIIQMDLASFGPPFYPPDPIKAISDSRLEVEMDEAGVMGTLVIDVVTSTGEVIDPLSVVGFNPQPEPPSPSNWSFQPPPTAPGEGLSIQIPLVAGGGGAGAGATRDVTLTLQVLDDDDNPMPLGIVPATLPGLTPGAIAGLAILLAAAGTTALRRTRRR